MKVVFACIFNEFAIARTNELPKKCITSFVGISSLIFEIVTEQRRGQIRRLILGNVLKYLCQSQMNSNHIEFNQRTKEHFFFPERYEIS